MGNVGSSLNNKKLQIFLLKTGISFNWMYAHVMEILSNFVYIIDYT